MIERKPIKNRNPLVSVIMPVHNSGKYLSPALNSVLNQTYKNFEFIIVDDASTDNSQTILKDYAKKYPKKIKLLKNTVNMGVSYSSNKAISKSKGNYIARMDGDDLMFPERLELQVKFLEKNKGNVLVGGQVVEISESGEFLGERKYPLTNEEIYKKMPIFMSVLQGATMINKNLLPKDFVWYRNDLRVAEDMDLFFRLFKYGKFANLHSFILSYRRHPFSISRKWPKETFALTNKCRVNAILSYDYKPTAFAILMIALQTIAVALLPEKFVVLMYVKLRGIKLVNESIKTKALKLNTVSSIVL